MNRIRQSSVYARSLKQAPAQEPVKTDRLLKIEDVMARLNCSKSYVYAQIDSGALAHVILGSGVRGKRVKESVLEAFLEKKTAETGA